MKQELSPQHEKLAHLQQLKDVFFGTWGKKHSVEIPGTEVLEHHPTQAINVFKSEGLRPSQDVSYQDIMKIGEVILTQSFDQPEMVQPFLETLHQPYPYEDGNGRTYVEYLVEEFIEQGISVGPLVVHADKGLTDVPRTAVLIRHSLGQRYGDKYFNCTGEIASPTLQYEKYNGSDVPDALFVAGDVIWMPPDTESVNEILKLSGLTPEQKAELYGHIAKGSMEEFLRDVKAQPTPHKAKVIVISPSGTRSEIISHDKGSTLAIPPVGQSPANLINRYGAVWPFGIIQDRVKPGPIIKLPKAKGLSQLERYYHNLQNIEDAVEIVGLQLDNIVKIDGFAKLSRATRRGVVFEQGFGQPRERALGRRAITL